MLCSDSFTILVWYVLLLLFHINYFQVLCLWASNPIGPCQKPWEPWQLWQLPIPPCSANQLSNTSLWLCLPHWLHLPWKLTLPAQTKQVMPILQIYMKSLPGFHNKIWMMPLSTPMLMPDDNDQPPSHINMTPFTTPAGSQDISQSLLTSASEDAFDYKKCLAGRNPQYLQKDETMMAATHQTAVASHLILLQLQTPSPLPAWPFITTPLSFLPLSHHCTSTMSPWIITCI